MTTDAWLILGLVGWLVVCLLAIIISHMINAEWDSADAPTYRTADGKAIEDQTNALRSDRP